MEKQKFNVNISTETIVKIILFGLAIGFFYLIKDILLIVFAALILASAFDPMVDWFQKRKIPRALGIIIIYIVLFSVLAGSFILIIPPISNEIGQLAQNFPSYYNSISEGIINFQNSSHITAIDQLQNGLTSLGNNLPSTVGSIFGVLYSIFGGIFSMILVLVITFYFTAYENATKSFVQSITPAEKQPYILRLYNRIQIKLGQWLRGQLILSLVIFALTFIGLTILGVPYALILAFIAGILEIVPTIGPILSAVPALFFGFLQSPVMGLSVVILYMVIQWLENNLIVPKVMSKSVGLNPLVVIVGVLIGVKIGGIFGALFAVPVMTALSVFLDDVINKRQEQELEL